MFSRRLQNMTMHGSNRRFSFLSYQFLNELFHLKRHTSSCASIRTYRTHQSSQPICSVVLNPAAGGTERKVVRSCNLRERNVTFQKRLDDLEALKGQLLLCSRKLREELLLVYHIPILARGRERCQKMPKERCHILHKATHMRC